MYSDVNTDVDATIVDELAPAGWVPDVRTRLHEILRAHEGSGRAAVFDFDNTVLCGDHGDAVLGRIVADGVLDRSPVAAAYSPNICVDGVDLRMNDDPIAYYNALQRATVNYSYDPEPRAAAYAWAVQVMAGQSPADIVHATQRTFDVFDDAGRNAPPFAYPEMVDLLGQLLARGFRLYIVSATNVWSTRWTVLNVINPELRQRFGAGVEVRAENVIGISLMMKDRGTGRLYSDTHLLGTNPAYKRLDPDALSKYELTPFFSFPVPTYAGKAGFLKVLMPNEQPLLVAGDSDNDLPLLAEAEHRIWIARLEEAYLQERVTTGGAEGDNWLVQPVLAGSRPGFLRSRSDVAARHAPAITDRSIACWRRAGHLERF